MQILPALTEHLTAPDHSHRNLNQSLPFLRKFDQSHLPWPSAEILTCPNHSHIMVDKSCLQKVRPILLTPMLDQSSPILKKVWPILPTPTESLFNTAYSQRPVLPTPTERWIVSCPLPQEVWPILPTPSENLVNPAYFYRRFGQSCPLLQGVWLILPTTKDQSCPLLPKGGSFPAHSHRQPAQPFRFPQEVWPVLSSESLTNLAHSPQNFPNPFYSHSYYFGFNSPTILSSDLSWFCFPIYK